MSTAEELAPRRSLVLPILGTLLHAILAAGLLAFFMRVPATKKMFDEYGLTLPLMAQFVIRVANGLAEFWETLWLLLPFAVVGDFLLFRYTERRPSLTWFVVATVVLFVTLGVSIFAIELPMMKLRNAIK
jgi:hypothetical protein